MIMAGPMTALDYALYYAEQGFSVLPVKKNAKVPILQDWTNKSSSDANQIRAWAEAYPDCNWGLDCGASDLLVVDVDCKEGQEGKAQWAELLTANGMGEPKTLVHRTSSGGLQFIFKGARKTPRKLADKPDIDLKSSGGQIILPGSHTEEERSPSGRLTQATGDYTILHAAEIAPVPRWIGALISEGDRRPAEVFDGTILDGNRNNSLASIGGTLRARGAPFEVVHATLAAANDTMLSSPLDAEEVEAIAKSVCRYAPDVVMTAVQFMEFSAKAEDPRHTIWGSKIDVAKMKAPDWIIWGRFIPKYITVTGAPPGVGKSRISMLEAIAIATGLPLTGQPIRRSGPVWYISEDPREDMEARFIGLCVANNIDPKTVRVCLTSLMELPLRLLDKEGGAYKVNAGRVEWVSNTIRQAGFIGVIFDPYARLHSCEENDNRAADLVAEQLQKIAAGNNCFCHVIHHTAKGHRAAGTLRGNMDALRGAGALVGAARIVWTVDHYNEKDDGEKWSVDPGTERQWIKMEPAKCNIALLTDDDAPWFFMDSIRLSFHNDPKDSVGVAVHKSPTAVHQAKPVDRILSIVEAVGLYMDANGTDDAGGLCALSKVISADDPIWAPLFEAGGPFFGKNTNAIYCDLARAFGAPRPSGVYVYRLDKGYGKRIVRGIADGIL